MLKTKRNRFILLILIEILLCLALLPGCFRKEILISTLNSNEIAEQLTQNEDHLQFISEYLELSPGVYQMKAQTTLTDEQRISIELKCASSYFKALRENSINTFSGRNSWNFNVYITDTISTAYIQCDFYGTDADALEQLQIYKTNSGFRMLLFTAILLFVALDFILVLHNRIMIGKVTKKQQLVFWSLTATILLSYFPFLTDYFFFGENTVFYLNHMNDARVSLLLCIPMLMMRLGFPIMTAYKMFVFVIITLTAIVTYMLFRKCVANESAALLGSSIYQLAIYRLCTLYEQAALGQACIMIFLPFAYCGIYLLCKGRHTWKESKKNIWFVLLGVFGMLQCYFLSADLNVLDVVWMLVHISVSLFAAFLFAKAQATDNIPLKITLGVVALINVFSSVYYTNQLVFQSTPVYLYSIDNLGIAGSMCMPEMTNQSLLLLHIAEGISLLSFVILAGTYFTQKRKRAQNGN